MARVHRLQKIERFVAADLADDDAFRTHAQTIAYQFAHCDPPLPFKIGRTSFQAYDVRLLQLQLGRVLASDDALIRIDITSQTIQQRGLARSGAAGDQDIAANSPDDPEDFGASRRNRSI